MEFFDLIISIEEKLLKYQPLIEIYDVEKHNIPFDNITGLIITIKNNWKKISDNFVKVLKALSIYIDKDDYLDNEESNINEDIFELYEISSEIYSKNFNLIEIEKISKTTLLLNLYSCCVVPQGNP